MQNIAEGDETKTFTICRQNILAEITLVRSVKLLGQFHELMLVEPSPV